MIAKRWKVRCMVVLVLIMVEGYVGITMCWVSGVELSELRFAQRVQSVAADGTGSSPFDALDIRAWNRLADTFWLHRLLPAVLYVLPLLIPVYDYYGKCRRGRPRVQSQLNSGSAFNHEFRSLYVS